MRRRQAHAVLAADGKTFIYDPGETSWASYESGKTLDEMVAASKRFAGAEKSELHPLIMHPSVIDVEIAFRSPTEQATSGGEPSAIDAEQNDAADESEITAKDEGISLRHDRLDAATLEDRDGALWIVFHEAKHFKNPELRAGVAFQPPVGEQIARYRRSIETYAPDIAASYREVCEALRELQTMRAKADPSGAAQATGLNPLIQRAANGEPLHVDGEPRLIVFGFDDDQKNGPTWTHHRQRLEDAKLTVYAVGKPNRKSAGAAFARSAS
jgi:hypothetical protein